MRKDRVAHGERQHLSKLTAGAVAAIINSDESRNTLAARYGVVPGTIWWVQTGGTWRRAL